MKLVYTLGVAVLAAGLVWQPPVAEGAFGDCGQIVTSGPRPAATDALRVLRTGVGLASCSDSLSPCLCDVNSDGAINATDALTVLRDAVGEAVALDCSGCLVCGNGIRGLNEECDGPDVAACDSTQCSTDCRCVAPVALPYAHTFSSDGRLLAIAGDERFAVDQGPWGTFALPYTGHPEGDYKSNGSIYIQPAGKLVELNSGLSGAVGNGDAVCDPGEVCGVMAADALAAAPWYTVEQAGGYLAAVFHDPTQQLDPYVPGESPEYAVTVVYGDVFFDLGHIGELSSYLRQLLAGSASSDQITRLENDGQPISFSAGQVPLEQGQRLGRPQVTFSLSEQRNGTTYYFAHSQVEWSVFPTSLMSDTDVQPCMFHYFPRDEQARLQRALDRSILSPPPAGRYVSWEGGGATLITVAAGEICDLGSTIRVGRFDRLNADGSGAWIDGPTTPRLGDVFAVFPIRKDTDAYRANAARFSAGADLMVFHDFARAGTLGTVQLSDGTSVGGLYSLGGEVLGLTQAGDTPAATTFIVHVVEARAQSNTNAQLLVGKYQAVRYLLLGDRLAVHWGELFDSAGAVVVPDPIDAAAPCDGNPIRCYDHDILTLFQ